MYETNLLIPIKMHSELFIEYNEIAKNIVIILLIYIKIQWIKKEPKHKVDWKDSHLCKSPSADTDRNALCVYAALCRL